MKPFSDHFESQSTELSSRRTGMSFQRTRMSADRTLMSVIRTALALISFGFTVHQFFHKAVAASMVQAAGPGARHFGISLLMLGVLMLILGIGYHIAFMRGLRRERRQLVHDGLLHGESGFPASMTLIVAVLLFVLGVVTAASIVLKRGPFQ